MPFMWKDSRCAWYREEPIDAGLLCGELDKHNFQDLIWNTLNSHRDPSIPETEIYVYK